MERERLKYWLALTKLKGLKLNELKTALSEVNDAQDFFTVRKTTGCGTTVANVREKAKSFSAWDWVEKELDRAEKLDVRIITAKDKAYPSLLKETHNPPLVLYAKGVTVEEPFAAVAVVGTRLASHYGMSMAENISGSLAEYGVTVVSGMARGCDTAAHKGTLKAGGYTIAVLGTGVDTPYPKENKKLYDEIAENGLLVSEYPLGTPPLAQNFPARNRIISGIALGVLVIEAPLKSGAMITAKMALDENREVFALPGHASGDKNSGSHKLIKEGASLAENAEDILSALFPGKTLKRRTQQRPRAANNKLLSELERTTLALLEDDEQLHIDELAQRTNTRVIELSAILLEMELKGLIIQKPGKIFVRKIFAQ